MYKYVVLGASPNPLRHSNRAIKSLQRRDKDVIAIGLRKGEIDGVKILKGMPRVDGPLKLLLYIGAKRQVEYYDYILGLRPKEIVFNPGAENEELAQLAVKNGIEVVEDCALVMINTGQL